MAKNEVKIDTTEATKKIKELQESADKLMDTLKGIKEAATVAMEAIQSFGRAASKIDFDS